MKSTMITVQVAFEITIMQACFTPRCFLLAVIPSTSLTPLVTVEIISAEQVEIR